MKKQVDRFTAAWSPLCFTAVAGAALAHHSWWGLLWLTSAVLAAVAFGEQK